MNWDSRSMKPSPHRPYPQPLMETASRTSSGHPPFYIPSAHDIESSSRHMPLHTSDSRVDVLQHGFAQSWQEAALPVTRRADQFAFENMRQRPMEAAFQHFRSPRQLHATSSQSFDARPVSDTNLDITKSAIIGGNYPHSWHNHHLYPRINFQSSSQFNMASNAWHESDHIMQTPVPWKNSRNDIDPLAKYKGIPKGMMHMIQDHRRPNWQKYIPTKDYHSDHDNIKYQSEHDAHQFQRIPVQDPMVQERANSYRYPVDRLKYESATYDPRKLKYIQDFNQPPNHSIDMASMRQFHNWPDTNTSMPPQSTAIPLDKYTSELIRSKKKFGQGWPENLEQRQGPNFASALVPNRLEDFNRGRMYTSSDTQLSDPNFRYREPVTKENVAQWSDRQTEPTVVKTPATFMSYDENSPQVPASRQTCQDMASVILPKLKLPGRIPSHSGGSQHAHNCFNQGAEISSVTSFSERSGPESRSQPRQQTESAPLCNFCHRHHPPT